MVVTWLGCNCNAVSIFLRLRRYTDWVCPESWSELKPLKRASAVPDT